MMDEPKQQRKPPMHPIPLNKVQSPGDAHNSMLKQAMENRNEGRSARSGGNGAMVNNFS